MPVAFSPDGTRIVSGSVDKSVLVWDTIVGKSTSLPEDESFLFPDGCKVTHSIPGRFQILTPGEWEVSLPHDRKLILTDSSIGACWIPSEFCNFAILAFSKVCFGCRAGCFVIVDLAPGYFLQFNQCIMFAVKSWHRRRNSIHSVLVLTSTNINSSESYLTTVGQSWGIKGLSDPYTYRNPLPCLVIVYVSIHFHS